MENGDEIDVLVEQVGGTILWSIQELCISNQFDEFIYWKFGKFVGNFREEGF